MNKKFQESLMRDEKIVAQAQFVALWEYVVVIVLGLFYTIMGASSAQSEDKVAIIVSGIVLIAIILLYLFVCGQTRTLAVTNKKVYGKTGILKTNELESPLKHIQNVQVKQSLLNKITKFGTIKITTASGVYNFKIYKPHDFKKALMSQIEFTEEEKMDTHANKIADAIYRKNNVE